MSRRDVRRRAGWGAVALVCALGLSPTAGLPQAVSAAWTDQELSAASIASTGVVAPTKNGCSIVLGLSVTYSWINPTTGAPRTGYVLEILRQGVVQASITVAAGATSASTSGLLSTLLGGVTYDVRVRAVSNTWSSPAVTGTFSTTLAGLITGCTW
ncbi:fibronectin type III domain-containing protein [Microbacterium sp. TNHR37B]|uniref:fibronectin type III domain-containing protein n=1 Tax=Microbacterium sp. TNHR37B TaxID=1775956 RepID=UPI0007B1B3FD|nr:fibronectin type III domain-containing protein [Microbacterium sp. TNHR37B]KZE89180.1 hypothetical protein AVP41_01972 [Microbacterium sp. TNHR37B]